MALPNDIVNWANDSEPQVVYNILPLNFPTATVDWGILNYWAICDAPVEGNNLIVGDLEQPIEINAGDQAAFDEGDLSVSLGPFYLPEDVT